MPLPSAGALTTDLIADEVGYTMSYIHYLAGPYLGGGGVPTAPGTFSLSYFYRPGNVSTSGVRQTAGFSMSAFYSQEAIYRCVVFTASNGITGSAEITTYYKNLQTVTFTASKSAYCVRQNWDGQMAIRNTINATWSFGSTCSASTGQSIQSTNTNYGIFGVRLFNIDGYDSTGNPKPTGGTQGVWNTNNYKSGTWSNLWWSNPSPSGTANGRLNNTGLWNGSNVPTGITAGWYVGQGFITFNINSPSSTRYLVGVGGDNGISISINGLTAFDQNASLLDTSNFRWWGIYPMTFSSGNNIVKVINTNVGQMSGSNPGSLGVEVYGNSEDSMSSILNAQIPNSTTQPDNLQVLYSSSNFFGAGVFYQNMGTDCPFTGSCYLTGQASVWSSGTTTTTTSTTTTTTTAVTGVTMSISSGVYPLSSNGVTTGIVMNTLGATAYIYASFNSGGLGSGTIANDYSNLNTSGTITQVTISGSILYAGQQFYSSGYYTMSSTVGSTISVYINKGDSLGGGSSLRLAYSQNPGAGPYTNISAVN